MELMLNPHKRDNYAFFDPESRLHLTASSPAGSVQQATSAIKRGINTGVLVAVENDDNKPAPKAEEKQAEEKQTEEKQAEEKQAVTDTEDKEQDDSPKSSRKKTKK